MPRTIAAVPASSAAPPAPQDIWAHLRRGSSFGPAPLQMDVHRPWLEAAHASHRTSRRVVVPPHLEAKRREEQQQQQRLYGHKAAPPPSFASARGGGASSYVKPSLDRAPSSRNGPCEERHLPLSKHAPRLLKTKAERRNPPKWQPQREWKVSHCDASGDGAPRTSRAGPPPGDSFAGVPLSGLISPRVVQHTLGASGEGGPTSTGGRGGGRACAADAAIEIRDTSGGWAADMTPLRTRAMMGAGALPTPLLYDDESKEAAVWPLEREVSAWQQKAGVQRAQFKERSTLGLVDDFLQSDLAREFLPDDGQGPKEAEAFVIDIH